MECYSSIKISELLSLEESGKIINVNTKELVCTTALSVSPGT